MKPDDPARSVAQTLEIAQRLGSLESRESVSGAGDGQVLTVLPGDLDEQAARGPALVELARRVEVARAPADRGRDAQAIAQGDPDLLEDAPRLGRRGQEGLDGEVVAGNRLGQVHVQALVNPRRL